MINGPILSLLVGPKYNVKLNQINRQQLGLAFNFNTSNLIKTNIKVRMKGRALHYGKWEEDVKILYYMVGVLKYEYESNTYKEEDVNVILVGMFLNDTIIHYDKIKKHSINTRNTTRQQLVHSTHRTRHMSSGCSL